MSVNEASVRSILLPLPLIEPDYWSAFHLDAYVSKRPFCLDPRSCNKPLKIKTNAIGLLRKKLAHEKRPLRDIVTIGFEGEPYVDVERHYRLTRGLLETLLSYGYPVHLMTNSFLVLEDIELLKQIAKSSFLHISVPMVPKHELYERFYPQEDYEEGLALLRALRLALPEIHISADILPLLPTVGDNLASLEEMIKALKRVGVDSIFFHRYELLNAKEIQIFLDTLQDLPDQIDLFVQRFDLVVEEGILIDGTVALSSEEREHFIKANDKLLEKYKVESFVPRYIPEDFRHSNYLLAQRLFMRASLCQKQGEEYQSIVEIAQKIQNMEYTVTKKELLQFALHEKAKRDIDYFLFNKELKVRGQARLF